MAQQIINVEKIKIAEYSKTAMGLAELQAEIKRKQDEIESQVKAQKAHEQEQLERKQRYEQYLADWDLAILQYATWSENKAFELANSEKIKAENELFESLGLDDVEFDFLEGNLTLRGALIAAYKQGAFPV